MDLFKKCQGLDNVRVAKEQGIYPYFHQLNSKQGPEVVMEGKDIIMIGSNNYLGLTSHPEVSPATPVGQALLRTSYTATHTTSQMDRAIEKIVEVLKILQVK